MHTKGIEMGTDLKKEFEWYLENQSELVEKYDGKFIVIKDHEVIGEFENFNQAMDETTKNHEKGTFIIQKCSAGEDDYTVTFHSRVVC